MVASRLSNRHDQYSVNKFSEFAEVKQESISSTVDIDKSQEQSEGFKKIDLNI